MKTIDKVREIHEDLKQNHKLNVVFTALYGSQNYGLDSEASDIDVQAYVVPNLDGLIHRKYINKTIKTKYGEATVKDIRELPELIKKSNPTTLEIMYTEHVVAEYSLKTLFGDDLDLLSIGNRHKFIKATIGTVVSKHKILTKQLDQSKVDPKEAAHFYRLCTMVEDIFTKKWSFNKALKQSSMLMILKHIRFNWKADEELEYYEVDEIRNRLVYTLEQLRETRDWVLDESWDSEWYDIDSYNQAIAEFEHRVYVLVRGRIREEVIGDLIIREDYL